MSLLVALVNTAMVVPHYVLCNFQIQCHEPTDQVSFETRLASADAGEGAYEADVAPDEEMRRLLNTKNVAASVTGNETLQSSWR